MNGCKRGLWLNLSGKASLIKRLNSQLNLSIKLFLFHVLNKCIHTRDIYDIRRRHTEPLQEPTPAVIKWTQDLKHQLTVELH